MPKAERAEKTSIPIEIAAGEIRDIVSQFVTQELAGTFPRNYKYGQGDYERVYTVIEGNWPNEVHTVTLDPDGQFRSGWVTPISKGDHTTLWFSQADLRPASGMEVVRYSLPLVGELFYQIVEELPQQSDIRKIGQWLRALSKQEEMEATILKKSERALREMGEEEPQIAHYCRNSGMKETPRRLAAYELYAQKDQLVAEVAELARSGRVGPVQDWFKSLVVSMGEGQIMPQANVKHSEKGDWFVLGLLSPHEWYQMEDGDRHAWYWAMSAEGELREVVALGGDKYHEGRHWGEMKVNDCAKHLLEQAPEIIDVLIIVMMVKIFPKAKWERVKKSTAN